MAKKLIHKNNIHEIYKEGEGEIFLSKEMILTPSAKDFIREKGITPTYKEISKAKEETLEEKIERILKDDFHMEDKKLIPKILDKIMGR